MSRLLVATFEDPDRLVEATRGARQRGYVVVDAYAPFPVHGLEEAMGLPPSRLTWACFFGGLAGLGGALGLELWTSAKDWPLNVGGKPLLSLPAFIPVAFELTILIAGLTVFAATLCRARLWPGRSPARTFERVTDDRFVLLLQESDAAFDARAVGTFLRERGAIDVSEREEAER